MKIAILIPDRGDRSLFLKNCLRQINSQTLKTDLIHIVDFKPISNEKDITLRYRLGYDYLRNKDIDVIAFWENDDAYNNEYLQMQINAWVERGKPDIFGIGYSVYYHLALNKWFLFEHPNRSSAMSTLIKPDLDISFPNDNDPYTDTFLWSQLKDRGKTWYPPKHLCINMKHGTGLTGGSFHNDRLHRFVNDNGKDFLRNNLDDENFKFYNNILNELQSNSTVMQWNKTNI